MAKQCYELTSVSFAYDGRPALRGLDLALVPGRFYGIVGPNGCGKTTLLDLLCGTRQPNEGQVRYRGRQLADYGRRELAREVALVPQDFAIGFSFTVEEVVLMGRHPYISRFGRPADEDWHLVTQAMAAIGIEHLRERYVNELSGGEKQRVVVARALAQQTPVLLLDEATSNLDIRHTLRIFNVARRLVRDQGRTVIGVIHNLNLAAAYCDELLFMQEGRLVASGPTGEVLAPELVREVFGVECSVRLDPFNEARQLSYRYWS